MNHPLHSVLPKAAIYYMILSSLGIFCYGQEESDMKFSLLFIGDIMGHDEQIWSAEDRETHTYNYDEVFTYVKPLISEADIAIANFEVTLAGQPYMGYPQFSSPASFAAACKSAGIDCLVTANNHSADRGSAGITGTIQRLDSMGIPHTGTFLNSAARDSLYPLTIEKNGVSIALLNYTYGTNGIKVKEPLIVNSIDRDIISGDMAKARDKNPDIIIVFLHWGTEYDTIPSQSQYDLAAYLFSEGADLVIGSHPHVLQKMMWSENSASGEKQLVVYSLGNFVSNQRKPKTDGGAMARIEITRNGSSFRISDAGYFLTWVYTPIEKYRKKYFILPCSEFENKPDFFADPGQYSQMKKFISDSRSLLNKQNVNVNEIFFRGQSHLLNY